MRSAPRLPRGRLAHRGHADPGHHRRRRRRSPAPRWPSAGSTSCEHLDDLRTLLMYEPRGHSAMSGAILQPPTRPDADCGRAVHRGVRLPADVRARHDRRGHRAGRDRHGGGHRAGHHDPARHPGRAGRRRGRGRGRRAPRRSRSATCRRSPPRSTRTVDVPGLRRRSATTWPSAATSTPSSTLDELGLPFDRAAQAAACSTPGWRSWTRSTRRTAPVHPERPGDRRLPPRLPRRARARTPGTPGTRWPSTPAGSTARRAAPAPRPDGPAARPRRAAAGHRLRQRVVHRHAGSSAGWSRRPRSAGVPAVVPTVTGRAWITGTAQYLLDPDDPFPAGFLL